MKKLLLLVLLFISVVANAQKGISYQAVILDPSKIEIPGQDITGQPFVNGNVSLKFVILSGTNIQFEEVQQTKTDAYGLVNLTIGSVASTAFNSVTWDSNQKSLQVFVSFDNGASYTKVSDQKLTFNPYALYAETAGKLSNKLEITGGGTGATTAVGARANLGLGNVDNTADADKPISSATQAALNLKASITDVNSALAMKATVAALEAHMAITADTNMLATKAALTDLNNFAPKASPTFTGTVSGITKSMVGLGSVDNTSDAAKPISAATQAALDLKLNSNGNAATATTLAAAKKINGVDFDGSADITVAADAGTLSGTLAIAKGGTGATTATDARTNLGLVIGTNVQAPLTAGTDYLTPTGNAATATKLAVAKKINGVDFDGSADITVAADAATLSGTLAIANGGTGLTAPGTTGQILSSTGSGTLTWTTSSGVPYTGATGAVNLGAYDLTVNSIKVGKGGGSQSDNTAVGVDGLKSNTTGASNTANGYESLYSNTIGSYNTANGISSLKANTTGSFNTGLGSFSLLSCTTCDENVAIGANSLNSNVSGNNNTAIGVRALASNATGYGNTAIGGYAEVGANNLNNATAIGYQSTVSTSNTIQLGNSDVTNVNTSGTLTAGTVTYPKTHGTNGQVLSTTGTGTLTWTSPSGGSSQWTTTSSNIYYNTGNVGIGLSTPGSGFNTKLDLQGRASFRTNGANSGLVFDGYSPSGSLQVARIYTDALSGTPSDFVLGTYPNGHMKQLFLKQSNGFVGVNNDNPTSQLDVAGNLKASGTLTSGAGLSTIAGSLVIGASYATGTSAALEVKSTSQGLLLPRLTALQRDAIVNPTQGLMVFCISAGQNGQLQVFNGSSWTNFIGGATFKSGKLYNYRSSVLYSFDGATWANTGIGVPNNGFNGATGSRSYIGTIGEKTYHHDPYTQTTYSFDGVSWTTESSTVPNNGFNGAIGGRSYVGVINSKAYHWDPYAQVFYSFDGTTWATVNGSIPNSGFNGAVGSRSLVGVINNKAYHWDPYAQVFYSFDGTTWATVQGGIPNNGFNGAVCSRSYVGVINNKAYHYDPYGQLFYSFDGTSWTTENITVPNFNGSLGARRSYVGVLDNKAYHYNSYTSTLYSFDGTVWESINTNTPSSIGGWFTDIGSTSFVGIAW